MSAVLTKRNSVTPAHTTPLTNLESAILQTVAYVDGFDYPLTADEVHRFLIGVPATPAQVAAALANGRLIPHHLNHHDNHVMLSGREHIVATRQQRQATAQQMWPAARQYGRLMAQLPFVRLVAITGSLAVNNAIEGADIDYLIVTANGRLWVTRACVILIVRLAAQRGVPLCPNYFLSQRALRIAEQNLYTAHELVQMIPLAGLDIYEQFKQLNDWTSHYLPNAPWQGSKQAYVAPAYHPRRLAEWALYTPVGASLERWEMTRKIRKFSQQQTAEADFSPDWCKGHFDDHAQHILNNFQERLYNIEHRKFDT